MTASGLDCNGMGETAAVTPQQNFAKIFHIHEALYLGHRCEVELLTPEQFQKFDVIPLGQYEYMPFCDDFGPFNIAVVLQFIDALNEHITTVHTKKFLLCSDPGPRNFTNAAFLIGCFLIMERNMAPSDAWNCFSKIPCNSFEFFRDATFQAPNFLISLVDCFRGLYQGMKLGWIDRINIDEYCHYDDPLNGDLHVVVPDRFIAFKGPKHLDGVEYTDRRGHREFSPLYYVDIFRELGVRTVVRLNESEYEPDEFRSAGIEHFDLEFEDCSPPPDFIVASFVRIVDSSRGVVAVHCKAGLGRTGTLIALYIMRHYNFTAREAISWLRIMRPGMVIDEQQHYLCEVERLLAGAPSAAADPLSPSPSATDASSPPTQRASLSPPPSPHRTNSSSALPLPPSPTLGFHRTSSASALGSPLSPPFTPLTLQPHRASSSSSLAIPPPLFLAPERAASAAPPRSSPLSPPPTPPRSYPINAPPPSPMLAPSLVPAPERTSSAVLASQVAEAMNRRAAARIRGGR